MISCFFFERTRPAASMRPPCLIYLSTSNNGTAGSIGPRIRKYLHTSQQYCTVMKSGEAHSLEDATGWFKLSLLRLSLIHISEPTRLGMNSYAVFCLKKKNNKKTRNPAEPKAHHDIRARRPLPPQDGVRRNTSHALSHIHPLP